MVVNRSAWGTLRGVGESSEPQIGRRKARADADALRAAIAAVEDRGYAGSVSEIEAQLVEELRARSCFMSPTEIRIQALRIHDADWFKNHPGALEEMLATESESVAGRQMEEAPDRTMDRLEDMVDGCRGVRSFSLGAHGTVDGVTYEICINPWSPRLARRIERKAAPTPVQVEPLEDEPEPEYARQIKAAIDSGKVSGRGLSQQDVEGQLRTALDQRDVTLPQKSVQFIAREISDPWWQLKHPFRARREFRR